MTRSQRIQAAKELTEANQDKHGYHLEEGYIEGVAYDIACKMPMGEDECEKTPSHHWYTKTKIWGINSYGEAVAF